jgi:hypothetical protein
MRRAWTGPRNLCHGTADDLLRRQSERRGIGGADETEPALTVQEGDAGQHQVEDAEQNIPVG